MILILFAAILLILFISKKWYAAHWADALKVRLEFAQTNVYAGETARLYEVIENRKRLPVFLLEVGFRIPKGLLFQDTENTNVSDYVYKNDVYALQGFQRVTRTLYIDCEKRGRYPVQNAALTGYSLFRTGHYRMDLKQDSQLYVYCRRANVNDILPILEAAGGEQMSRRKYLEDPFSFESIRSYTPQDPMKTINWKASAKSGEWMVNTYSSTRSLRLMLLLDLADTGIWKQDNLIENSISIAATLAERFLNDGQEVGIAVNAAVKEKPGAAPERKEKRIVLSPEKGGVQRHAIEKMLTEEFDHEHAVPVTDLLELVPDTAIPVLISKNAAEETMDALQNVLSAEDRGILVIPYERGEMPEMKSRGRVTVVPKRVQSR